MNQQPSAPFTPPSIPGLSAWYETDFGATVAAWLDQSGNANTLAQANPLLQPAIIAPDPELKPPQGSYDYNLPAQRMDALSSVSLNFSTTDFIVAFYAKVVISAGGMVMGKDSYAGGAFNGWFLQWNTPTVRFSTRNSGSGNINYLDVPEPSFAWHTWILCRVAGVIMVYVDNVLIGSLAEMGPTDTDNASNFKINAADDFGTLGTDQKIAALLMYKATATAQRRAQIHAYLEGKYKL